VGFLAVLTIGINAVRYGASPLSEEVLNSFAQFFGDFSFWSIALYAGVVVDVALFFSEIKDFVGVNVYANYAFGKYHRPKREIRIFMFLDMKSSTTIAEKMGHAGYFNLIKSYYSEMTDAILETSGEIYQYVGDEIVVSWGQEEGLLKNNCVRCFEMIKLSMKNHETTFKDKHKFVPEFKAGLHIGEVTKGEIGTLKKEIIYTGDVLNTAARIQSLCNQYRASMLISGTLREQLTQSADYRFSEIGNITLRGKSTSLPIYRLEY
jgi:adenylate cyclase